jgi:outer membrane protein OmpA-like peptidoglycan-associated protein
LLSALTSRFGEDKFNANVSVDTATKPAMWLGKLDALLPLMALPGAEVKLTGDRIELSGTAAQPELGWIEKLKAAFGETMTVGAFDTKQAVASATDSFMHALGELGAEDCAPADLAKVLNLQVINFATASGATPDEARAGLAKSATLLTRCASAGNSVKLEVAGYSDDVGDANANRVLSKKRAQAVRGYLVEQGVAAATLSAEGYGDARPVADNDTESGRFANRRIEFVVK